MSWDWARGTLTGWQDELRLNRRFPFPPPADLGPDVPAIRAGREPLRPSVEPPAPRDHDLRLRRRPTEDERVPSEQLDVIPRGARAGRPGETMRCCDRRRLSRRGSRRRGRRRRRFRIRRGRRRRRFRRGGARWLVLERERRPTACRARHARSVAVDHERRRDDDGQADDGRDQDPTSASSRPGASRRDRRRVSVAAGVRRTRSRRRHRGRRGIRGYRRDASFLQSLAGPRGQLWVDEDELGAHGLSVACAGHRAAQLATGPMVSADGTVSAGAAAEDAVDVDLVLVGELIGEGAARDRE
jgi:hypothetical protein